MEKRDLIGFEKWFTNYTQNMFSPLDDFDRLAVYFRLRHTRRVRQLITELATSLDLDEQNLLLADTIALFHDIGRFPQWQMWKTFNDAVSADHGALGVALLKDSGLFDEISSTERDLILGAIERHNALSLPTNLSQRQTFFAKLIRDADRLDIFQIHVSYLKGENPFWDKTIKGELPDLPTISDTMINKLMSGRMPSKRDVKTQNDLTLMVIGWIFDLSFAPCRQYIIRASILDSLFGTLPDNEKLKDLKSLILDHLQHKAEDFIPLAECSHLEAGC